MSKAKIFLTVGIIIVGSGLFFILKDSKTKTSLDQTNQTDQNEQENTINKNNSGKKMSFSTFLEQDKDPYRCTVSQYIDEGMSQTTEGLIFLNNGKIRGDFETNVSGMNIKTSTIVKDGFVYTWTNMSPFGFKSKAVDGQGSVVAGTSGTYSWNSEQIGDYDCQPWVPQDSQFELPNITFQEM
jgi:hypothetical protein